MLTLLHTCGFAKPNICCSFAEKAIIMKIKYIIIVFLVSIILETLGVYFKMYQLMGALELMQAATALKLLAAVLGVWKLFSVKEFGNFLDK